MRAGRNRSGRLNGYGLASGVTADRDPSTLGA
jgi:hypothetical protein